MARQTFSNADTAALLNHLGIRNAVKRAYGLEDLPKPAQLLQIAEKWQPYRTVASWYLWRSLDGPADLG